MIYKLYCPFVFSSLWQAKFAGLGHWSCHWSFSDVKNLSSVNK